MNPTFFQYAMYVVPWAAFIHYYARCCSLKTEREYLIKLHMQDRDHGYGMRERANSEYRTLEAKYDRLVARLKLPTKNED